MTQPTWETLSREEQQSIDDAVRSGSAVRDRRYAEVAVERAAQARGAAERWRKRILPALLVVDVLLVGALIVIDANVFSVVAVILGGVSATALVVHWTRQSERYRRSQSANRILLDETNKPMPETG